MASHGKNAPRSPGIAVLHWLTDPDPSERARRAGLKPIHKILLVIVAQYQGYNASCRASQVTIAADAEVARSSAQAALEELVACGWLGRAYEAGKNGPEARYSLTLATGRPIPERLSSAARLARETRPHRTHTRPEPGLAVDLTGPEPGHDPPGARATTGPEPGHDPPGARAQKDQEKTNRKDQEKTSPLACARVSSVQVSLFDDGEDESQGGDEGGEEEMAPASFDRPRQPAQKKPLRKAGTGTDRDREIVAAYVAGAHAAGLETFQIRGSIAAASAEIGKSAKRIAPEKTGESLPPWIREQVARFFGEKMRNLQYYSAGQPHGWGKWLDEKQAEAVADARGVRQAGRGPILQQGTIPGSTVEI